MCGILNERELNAALEERKNRFAFVSRRDSSVIIIIIPAGWRSGAAWRRSGDGGLDDGGEEDGAGVVAFLSVRFNIITDSSGCCRMLHSIRRSL